MKISEFTMLDIDDRVNLVWDEGKFIDKFVDTEHLIHLYFLDNFYVEVTVSKSNQEIKEIFAFKKSIRLEKYLNKISLKNLV
jgi:hypothetical protein